MEAFASHPLLEVGFVTWSFLKCYTRIHAVLQVFVFPPFHSNDRSDTAVSIGIEWLVHVTPDRGVGEDSSPRVRPQWVVSYLPRSCRHVAGAPRGSVSRHPSFRTRSHWWTTANSALFLHPHWHWPSGTRNCTLCSFECPSLIWWLSTQRLLVVLVIDGVWFSRRPRTLLKRHQSSPEALTWKGAPRLFSPGPICFLSQ